jgi:hypothetical protein
MTATTGAVLLLLLVAVVVLARVHRRSAVRAARDRAAVLDDVVDLLDDVRAVDGGGAHPTLTGTVDGRPVTLRLVVDSLTMRKLPVLWLEVVQRRNLAVAAPLNLLLRPAGTEFFSPDGRHDHEIAPPAGWPRPLRLSTTDPRRAPAPAVLAPAEDLLHDPRLKEIGLGRGGVRAVWMVAEADQAAYRLGRRAVFGSARVAAHDLRRVLAVLSAVGDRTDRTPPDRTPATRAAAERSPS